jgi:transposase-like protein
MYVRYGVFGMAKKPGKANLRKAIDDSGGVIGDIAKHFDVTRRTIYRWLDHYEMRGVLDAARADMRVVAKDVMYQTLVSEPDPDDDKAKDRQVKVAQFTLNYMGSDGEFITVSPDVMRLLPLIGMTVESASSLFEEMIREAARQKQVAA